MIRSPGIRGFFGQATLSGILLTVLMPQWAGASDLVNERPPMRAADLEAHWQVDCTTLQAAADRFLDGHSRPDDPGPAGMRNQARLCAAIYNQPGTDYYRPCPDFSSLEQALAALDSADLPRATLPEHPSCPPHRDSGNAE